MKVKVMIKVTVDGDEVAKEKVVAEVNSREDAEQLQSDAKSLLTDVGLALRAQAGM